MAEGEEDDKPDDLPDVDELRRETRAKERDGLCDDGNLEVFVKWLSWGGMERGMSVEEIVNMPAARMKDFEFLFGIYNKARKRHKRLKDEKKKPKKGKK